MIIKTYIINWLGLTEYGITAQIGINVDEDTTYLGLYWFDRNNHTLILDTNFLEIFNVKEPHQLPFYNELLADVASLINKEELYQRYEI